MLRRPNSRASSRSSGATASPSARPSEERLDIAQREPERIVRALLLDRDPVPDDLALEAVDDLLREQFLAGRDAQRDRAYGLAVSRGYISMPPLTAHTCPVM